MKGATIKKLMIDKGLTQAELAKGLGIPPRNLSAALSTEDVRSSLIEGIAQVLGLPVSSIYGEAPASPTANAVNNSTAIAGNANLLNQQLDKCLDLLKEKDIQVSRFQSEIETLLDIIKSQSK